MGLPIERLIVATNTNDILHRTLTSGRYEVRGVTPTSSPSMDIQVSSNFERLIFELEGRDAGAVRRLMGGLAQSGAFTLGADVRTALAADFASGACDEPGCASTMRRVRERSGYLLDPHTAVGVAVAERHVGQVPMITLATAHPAKFPDAVEQATGERPELPEWAKPILKRKETYKVLPADLEAVEEAIADHSRATKVAG
jgi:threonine synthase